MSKSSRLFGDEITSGFRLHFGAAHLKYGVEPDIAVFAKALSNGHSMAAVIGRRSVMSAAEKSFISSTYWTEGVGPTAALATLEKMSRINVPAHLERIGLEVRQGLAAAAARHQVPLVLSGHPALTSIAFAHPKNQALTTLFTTRMLDFEILASSAFYASLAHQDEHVRRYQARQIVVFAELADAINADDVEARIAGPVRISDFTRLS